MRICCLTDGKGNETGRLLTSKKSLRLFFFILHIFFCVHRLSQFLLYHQASILFTGQVLMQIYSISSRGVAALHLMARKNQLKFNKRMAAQNSIHCQKFNYLKLICSVSVMVKLDFYGLNFT